MLRRMSEMPVGTIGFEAIGEVEDDDWEQAVEPVLRREMAEGQKIRLLYLVGADAREVDTAMMADTAFRAPPATAFERVAVVSDEDWLRPAVRGLSFLLPGKARAFPLVHDLAAAKEWLAEGVRSVLRSRGLRASTERWTRARCRCASPPRPRSRDDDHADDRPDDAAEVENVGVPDPEPTVKIR